MCWFGVGLIDELMAGKLAEEEWGQFYGANGLVSFICQKEAPAETGAVVTHSRGGGPPRLNKYYQARCINQYEMLVLIYNSSIN